MPRLTLAVPSPEIPGLGLFSGKRASVRIVPAESGAGIAIQRVDLPGAPRIPADLRALAPAPPGMPARNTNLAVSPTAIAMTLEHILSALAGLAIDDALIELRGPEVPIGDGSAVMFVEAIQAAGVREQAGRREPIRLEREVMVESGAGRIVARPRERDGASYRYELDYGPASPIPAQSAAIELGGGTANYAGAVAPARTFCLQAEAEHMRAMGLFKDLSPRDLLVIGERGPIDNAYRFDNEPARHKLLDLIGDMALVGRPIQAEIVATRAGHALNHAMARELARLGASKPPLA
jgi:UDP-3-O-acyl N-acetylglucosamine deacetylase